MRDAVTSRRASAACMPWMGVLKSIICVSYRAERRFCEAYVKSARPGGLRARRRPRACPPFMRARQRFAVGCGLPLRSGKLLDPARDAFADGVQLIGIAGERAYRRHHAADGFIGERGIAQRFEQPQILVILNAFAQQLEADG